MPSLGLSPPQLVQEYVYAQVLCAADSHLAGQQLVGQTDHLVVAPAVSAEHERLEQMSAEGWSAAAYLKQNAAHPHPLKPAVQRALLRRQVGGRRYCLVARRPEREHVLALLAVSDAVEVERDFVHLVAQRSRSPDGYRTVGR